MINLENLAPPIGWRARVLVVDDDHAQRAAMEALLDDLGCEVVLCSSGEEALRQLAESACAVMLLDVQMPGMDGYEVARRVRSNPETREVPILFLTAMQSSTESVLRGYGSGAVDFLFKPIDADILRSKVTVFLELYASRRQLADANGRLAAALEELRSTQARLVQSAKMASLGELVAGVAHEINNPLAFVIGHVDTARRGLAEVGDEISTTLSENGSAHWARSQKRLAEIGPGLERIRELVIKLRTFSRLDEGEQKVVSIRECVESVLTILGHRLTDSISLEARYGEPDWIECYPGLLNQAIMNLVANAIDAVQDAGTITIETGEQGGAYVLSVRDTGSGIPAELKDRVFDPFFTTKPVGKGTGLGLPITYSIVEKHGGTLELRDAAPRGTLATIRLPLQRAPESRRARSR